MKSKIFTLVILSFIFQNVAKSQNTPLVFTKFSKSKLDSITDIKNADDSRMFVVEQSGLIRILDSVGNVMPTPFLDLTNEVNTSYNESGLLGMVFSPDYKTNGYFFVYYSDKRNHIHLARFQDSNNPDVALKSSEDTVLIINHNPYTSHYGGDMAFGTDGYLYIGVGDGGYWSNGDPLNRAQNVDTLLGKMLRLDVSSLPYKIPPSNPFVNKANGRPEIWAYGFRNPWGWSFDKLTGDLWIGDVGQDTSEEIDFQPANDTGGHNYGWRCYEGDFSYDNSQCSGTSNFTFPIDTYEHSPNLPCNAIIGGYVYRGARFKSLFGKYIYADLCSGRFSIINDSNGLFPKTNLNSLYRFQCTKFGQDEYGELYIGLRDSGVYKITDTSCAPVAFISQYDTLYVDTNGTLSALYGQDLMYQWEFNNNPIPGNKNAITVDSSGIYTVTVSNGKCSSLASQFVIVSATGINNPKVFKNLQIAPNPNNGTFNIYVSIEKSLPCTIHISDVLGRTILNEDALINEGKSTIRISENSFSPGVYFLKIASTEGESDIKFVVTE